MGQPLLRGPAATKSMSSWNEIRRDIERRAQAGDQHAHDTVRREKLTALVGITQRPLVVYAVAFDNLGKVQLAANEMSIMPHDKDGWVEVTRNLPDGPLDVMLHSPGGLPSVAEWVVTMLRSRFGPIRFMVPHSAKSAAAMIALSGDDILMDEVGELGPIDPQMVIPRAGGAVVSPAQAILDQFESAKKDVTVDPQRVAVWLPILTQYGPSLLEQSRNAIDLAKKLVRDWLRTYMFAGLPDAKVRAERIANWIGNHNNFKDHGRHIGIAELMARGVKVVDLRNDLGLREAIGDVWSCYRLTLDGTAAFKMFENSQSEAFIRRVQLQQQLIQVPAAAQPPQQPSSSN